MKSKDKELVKSLTSLIDETLEEIEQIKKSKYAASEIKIEGPGEGIAGKPTNGELDAKKKEDKKKEDEDEDKDDMDKGENEKADEDHGKFEQAPSVSKGENEKADEDHGKFEQAPTVSKKEDKDEETKRGRQPQEEGDIEEDHDDKKMKKSAKESEDLMKSYVDTKFDALEKRLSQVAEMMEAMADSPVERRGVPAGVTALAKSNSDDQVQPLSKSKVASSLFELKKSGTQVDSSDIFRVETSKNYGELKQIADKYGVK